MLLTFYYVDNVVTVHLRTCGVPRNITLVSDSLTIEACIILSKSSQWRNS